MSREIDESRSEVAALLKSHGFDQKSPRIERYSRDNDTAPTSYAQQRLWFMEQLQPGSAAYSIPVGLRLSGDLDVESLQWSLSEVVRRHEVLRTRFGLVGGEPVQLIEEAKALMLEVADLSDLGESESQALAHRLAQEEAARPFDLEQGPLFRARLLRLGGREHVLLVNMHHIVSDGWSMGVLVREVSVLYKARRGGESSPLAELPVQYADYAYWQRKWLQGEVLQKQLDYWRQQLAGLETLNLPSDYPRPALPSGRGERRTLVLDTQLDDLKGFAKSRGVTLFVVVMAAFQALLNRYSGQSDVVVGTTVANRNQEEWKESIGLFVNQLAIRGRLEGNPTVEEWILQTRDVCYRALANQAVPFDTIIQDLRPDRDLSRNPIFQVMLVLQNLPAGSPSLQGLSISTDSAFNDTSKFDLLLNLEESGSSLKATLEYSTDLFSDSTAAAMLRHFGKVLSVFVTRPHARLNAVDILPALERQQILEVWTATARPYNSEITLPELFDRQRATTPDNTALICGEERFTYAELGTASDLLASSLRTSGVGPEILVGILFRRSAEMIIGILAILKAGGAYVPLDPEYPSERLSYMIGSLEIKHLLIHDLESLDWIHSHPVSYPLLAFQMSRIGTSTPQLGAWRVVASEYAVVDTPRASQMGQRKCRSTNLAYVIFTSGSTGRPKGVMVRHRQVVNLIEWINRECVVGPEDCVLLVAALNFDLSVYDVFGALAIGASIRIATKEEIAEPESLLKILDSGDVSIWDSAPAALQQVAHLWQVKNDNRTLGPRLFLLSGDWIPIDLPAKITTRYPQAQVLALGGATEAVIWSNYFHVQSVDPEWVSIPYGKPIQNARYYVLDKDLNPLPVSIPGDLYIGGDCLADGYARNPALTAASFLPDPYARESGARMYRTGDMARWRKDGNLEFLGRLDGQVKIRGFRVELGEIEHQMRRFPGVEQAVVLPKRRGEHVELVGFCLDESGELNSRELDRQLRQNLPQYMVPSSIILLNEWPVTDNGKLDRKRLLEFNSLSNSQSTNSVDDLNPFEQLIAAIWQEYLRVPSIRAQDSFFDVGGHSVMATQVVAEIYNRLGIQARVRTLFESESLRDFAAAIEKLEVVRKTSVKCLVGDRGQSHLSADQKRLWIVDQYDKSYVVPIALRLKGDLDFNILQKCLETIFWRHELFHSQVVIDENGEPRWAVIRDASLPLKVIDVSETEGVTIEQVLGTQACLPFDLQEGPLIRFRLFRIAADNAVLFVNMHLIISDAWSVGILLDEFTGLYNSLRKRAPIELPPILAASGDQSFDAAPAEEDLERQLRYWMSKLADLPGSQLPTDYPRPRGASNEGKTISFMMEQSQVGSLLDLCREESATLFMGVLAVWLLTLGRWSGQSDVATGTDLTSRSSSEIQRAIGFFVKQLVLRVEILSGWSFRELLRAVRTSMLEGYENQDLPFAQLVESLDPDRDLSRHPLFQVKLTFQNTPMGQFHLDGLQVEEVPIDIGKVKTDLQMTVWEIRGVLKGKLTYRTDLFRNDTVERLLESFVALLDTAGTYPDQNVWTMPVMASADLAYILGDKSRGRRPSGLPSVIQLFSDQVERVPQALAVRYKTHALTFGELDRESTKMAHVLWNLGARSEFKIGAHLVRDHRLLVLLLAVWKVGGVFLPLDPNYPLDRLQFMVDDAKPFLVVSEEVLGTTLFNTQGMVVLWESMAEPEDRETKLIPNQSFHDRKVAYVMYTSGSTGRPKGVMIEHRGLTNHVTAKIDDLKLTEKDVIAETAPSSFDISIWQLIAGLIVGARIEIVEDDVVDNPAILLQELDARGVTVVETVPSILALWLDESQRAITFSHLRCVVSNAEGLPTVLAARWRTLYPSVDLVNTYGATECSDDISHFLVTDDSLGLQQYAPLGWPLNNTEVYLLGPLMQPVPLGAAGEIYIAGLGVGRGYLNSPGLTAAKFVPNPFGMDTGERIYRTGDLARWRPDRNLEFLGRVDQQVKIRGHRIELGEVEAALLSYPAIIQATAVVRPDRAGSPQLIGYIVHDAQGSSRRQSDGSTVASWKEVFDDSYSEGDLIGSGSQISTRVWINSYTGNSFDEQEIIESINDTVARILALKPRRVLEIGCGTGLLLSQIAPYCELYHATDLSSTALDIARERAHLAGLEQRVVLTQAAADELEGIEDGTFDLVIINEVIQFFPSVQYLLSVIEKLPRVMAASGKVFIGGVRNFELLDIFHLSVTHFRAANDSLVEDLRHESAKRVKYEKELLISPEFFRLLKHQGMWPGDICLELKGGVFQNEFTKFRYDALLTRERSTIEPQRVQWISCDDTLNAPEGFMQLLFSAPDAIGIAGVPNSRLISDLAMQDRVQHVAGFATVGEVRHYTESQHAGGVDPEMLREFGTRAGYHTSICWSGSGEIGSYDVLFTRIDLPAGLEVSARPLKEGVRALSACANWPLQQLAADELIPAVRSYLRTRLPEYMIPTALVRLDQMPLTPNGKVDRRALPAPESEIDPSRREAARSDNPEEELLCGIFEEVLRVDNVGPSDSFFDLGGHSLLATQVIARIRKFFGVPMSLQIVFENPTVKQLAEVVKAALRAGSTDALSALVLIERGGGGLPVSYAQLRLWFMEQLQPGSAAYSIPVSLRLCGDLDAESLRWSLSEVVRRHEVLRTRFGVLHGEPVQLIEEAKPVALEVEDLSSLDEVQAAAHRLAKEAAARPFDLERGPLFRARLLRLGDQEHVLLVNMHHIVSDGWSMGVLVREVSALYKARSGGEPSPLAELPVQYADYASWQRKWLEGEVLQKQLDYWRQQLAGLETLNLPSDYPRPALPSSEGASVEFEIRPEVAEQLRQLSRKQGVTSFMVLLAVWQMVLSRWSGQQDITVGTDVANRMRPEIEPLIGFFVNQLVLRTDLSGNPTFREVLDRVREVCLGAYSHQDLPFERLVEELNPERDLGRSPLFQVKLTLQNAHRARPSLGEIKLEILSSEITGPKLDLQFFFQETGKTFKGTLEYRSDLFESETMDRLLGHYSRLLASALERPDVPVSELEMLGVAERRQVLEEWNDTAASYPEDRCLHELIEDQVARTPSSTAVVFEGEQVSYAELNRRSNQLAHHLRDLGVGPEVLVGICLDRSIEMVVAVLAVLKAGGAYVPLDPAYPAERLAFMLQDSAAPILLTHSALAARLPAGTWQTLFIDSLKKPTEVESENPAPLAQPHNAAYVIYTSGSTGKPKGVVVQHQSLLNFHSGMNCLIPNEEKPENWVATTSISFDISILELLWTISRGAQVEVRSKLDTLYQAGASSSSASSRLRHFSLFFFASSDDVNRDKYRLLLESSRIADEKGFAAIWTPERHFHPFGGIYPNPAVTGAAIAAITKNVQIRAGSVVLPLHDPLRVAEEWSVVDNISDGRVAISFASGWNANDFVLEPQNFKDRKQIMFRQIEEVRSLWRGASISRTNGAGKQVEVKIHPQPIQKALPIWVTASGSPETFRLAGEIGANLLTHLLGQDLSELEEKIAMYRAAYQAAGHPGEAHVTLMLHTFVGEDSRAIRSVVHEPFCNYIRQSVDLVRDVGRTLNLDVDAPGFGEKDMASLVEHAAERYYKTSALIGDAKSCLEMLERVSAADADEVACLIDFGVDTLEALLSLERLVEVKDSWSQRPQQEMRASLNWSERSLQCTPSMAGALVEEWKSKGELPRLDRILVGGEALPAWLSKDLIDAVRVGVTNMYGPTETTIWSSAHVCVPEESGSTVPIGRPISNTQMYVLDEWMKVVPRGAVGELYIGGAGLARGYLNRPGLTAERFVPDPFLGGGGRLYRTGDLGRWNQGGELEFLGRRDHQVKLRGFRIELEEIESSLRGHHGLAQAVVVVREDVPGDRRLVAYWVPSGASVPEASALREHLQARLPDYMVPSAFVQLEQLPLTPNGKLDRKALPAPERAASGGNYTAPRNHIEEVLVAIWEQALGREGIGVHDNFFDLGGHSLLAMQVISQIGQQLSTSVGLQHLFEMPTVAGLAEIVSMAEAKDKERSAMLLDDIEKMSPAEVQALLAQLETEPS